MKKIMIATAMLGLMAAAPAYAGSHNSFSLSLGVPGPVYYQSAPAYYGNYGWNDRGYRHGDRGHDRGHHHR